MNEQMMADAKRIAEIVGQAKPWAKPSVWAKNGKVRVYFNGAKGFVSLFDGKKACLDSVGRNVMDEAKAAIAELGYSREYNLD